MHNTRQPTDFESHLMTYNESYSNGVMGSTSGSFRNDPRDDERRIRHLTEYLGGSVPKDDPVYLPRNQINILQQLSEQKKENLQEKRMRYANLQTAAAAILPRPSIFNSQYHNTVQLSNSSAPVPSIYSEGYVDPYTRHAQYSPIRTTDSQTSQKVSSGYDSTNHFNGNSYPTHAQMLVYQENRNHFLQEQTYTEPLRYAYGGQHRVGVDQKYSSLSDLRGERSRNPLPKKTNGPFPVSIGGAPLTAFKELGLMLQKRQIPVKAKKGQRVSKVNNSPETAGTRPGEVVRPEPRYPEKRSTKTTITVAVPPNMPLRHPLDRKARSRSSANSSVVAPQLHRSPHYHNVSKLGSLEPMYDFPPRRHSSQTSSLQPIAE